MDDWLKQQLPQDPEIIFRENLLAKLVAENSAEILPYLPIKIRKLMERALEDRDKAIQAETERLFVERVLKQESAERRGE